MALFTGSKFGFGKDSAGEVNYGPFIATGGTEVTAPDNSFKYWVFESSGAFTVSSGLKTIDYLVIGGGGAGGRAPGAAGAGGGAVSDGGDRSSGARGWEDRSYGGASADASSHDAGRTRRRRGGAAPEGEGGDSYSGYGGAEG